MSAIIYILGMGLSGLLGGLAGSEKYDKACRRVGIPIVEWFVFSLITCAKLGYLDCGVFLSFAVIFLMIIPYSLGYGVPDKKDKGSSIGRFWAKFFYKKKTRDILTRGTIAVLKCLCVIPVLHLVPYPGMALMSFVGIIGTNILFGGDAFVKDEKMVKAFGTEINMEEVYIAAFDFLFVVGLVIL